MLFQKSNITITVVNSNIESFCRSSSATETKGKKERLHKVTPILLSLTALLITLSIVYIVFESDSQTVSVLALEVLKILLEQICNLQT